MNVDSELDYHERMRAAVPALPWDERACGWIVGDTPAGDRVWVHPLIFTAAVIVGPVNSWEYDDRWCFHTIPAALAAANAWIAAGCEGEPFGWHRHPKTGRRRNPDGTEFVEW